MIIQSHWRKIKHDHLHRFNRPRIDLVIWILTSHSILQGLSQMRAIRIGDHRKAVASWRKSFKQTWKQHQNQEISSQSLHRYQTDPVKWTCGCEAFLLSRFLLCKHIIHCYEESGDPMKFFGRICRQRTCPFWTDEQLVLRPEFRVSENIITINSEDESSLD